MNLIEFENMIDRQIVDFACECVQYDIYGLDHDYYDDTAIEGSLVFDDDEDIYGNYYGAATEGLGATIGKLFNKVKEWLATIARALQTWANKFAYKVKNLFKRGARESVTGYDLYDFALEDSDGNGWNASDAKDVRRNYKAGSRINSANFDNAHKEFYGDDVPDAKIKKAAQDVVYSLQMTMKMAVDDFLYAVSIEDKMFEYLKKYSRLMSGNKTIAEHLGHNGQSGKINTDNLDASTVRSISTGLSDSDKAKLEKDLANWQYLDNNLKDKIDVMKHHRDGFLDWVKIYIEAEPSYQKRIYCAQQTRKAMALDVIYGHAMQLSKKCQSLSDATAKLADLDAAGGAPTELGQFARLYSSCSSRIVGICNMFMQLCNDGYRAGVVITG